MAEEERKFEAHSRFVMPDLSTCLPAGGRIVVREPVRLTATYYDTDDLRLARAGGSLRFRRSAPPSAADGATPVNARSGPAAAIGATAVAGAKPPGGARAAGIWTVKLATSVPEIRQEIDRSGVASEIPAELVALVTVHSVGAALQPSVVLRTDRVRYELRDRSDTLLAEVADDRVAVMSGRQVQQRFREIEVERREGTRSLLDRVGAELSAAGAIRGAFLAKHVRALGEPALVPPTRVPPGERPSPKASAGEVVTWALRRDIVTMLDYDALVRLGEPLPDGDTAVHQMRVGCRRLRSDLRTFQPLLSKPWVRGLRTELAWLADALGGARDAEVLRDRLARTASQDPLVRLDPGAVAHIDAVLAARHERALHELDKVMRTTRYRDLVAAVLDASAEPKLSKLATEPARRVLPQLVSAAYRLLAFGKDGVHGAGALDPLGEDHDWHLVRIAAKRARYATQAVAPTLGSPASELASALAQVQTLLGDHQDAAVAAQTWLDIAAESPADHTLAVTAGHLVERERAVIRQARAKFPKAWRRASRSAVVGWLP